MDVRVFAEHARNYEPERGLWLFCMRLSWTVESAGLAGKEDGWSIFVLSGSSSAQLWNSFASLCQIQETEQPLVFYTMHALI